MQTADRPLLSPSAVAERLALSRSTVYKLLEAGALPARKVGGQWRTDPDELNRWLARR